MTWLEKVDREELEKQARHAMAGLESFRRFVEGDFPYEHDYPKRGTPPYFALHQLDDAQVSLGHAVDLLGFDPKELQRAD